MRTILAALTACLATSVSALTPDDIRNASYDGSALPDGQSGLAVKLQVLLDRADISPGVIDGYKGGMTKSALEGFEARAGLPVDGVLDPKVWSALEDDGTAILDKYEITSEDTTDLTDAIPDHVARKAEMDRLGYTRVSEKLAERFHMDEDFLELLNPDASFASGETITVINTGARAEQQVARMEIRKATRRAVAFDENDAVVVNYPVAIGSDEMPSPEGKMEIEAIAMDPTYSYLPDENFTADGVTEKRTLPPGPNGPVGTVWLDLSKPTYGLHGTDTPSQLFSTASHGCVRFTNWDIEELAHLVSQGVVVDFVQ